MNTAVIFDMDGVLVNNARFHEQAFAEYFSAYGVTLKPEMHGRGNSELMEELFPGQSAEQHAKLADGKEAYYRKIYEPHLKPAEGLIRLLDELKRRRIPLAVGSSAPEENINFVLDGLQLRKYFDAVVIAAMVERAKPAPDIYLKAAELLNVAPQYCLVFEDAIAGIQSARTAGMKVAGIASSLPKDKLTDTDRTISDFTEITVDEILKITDQL
ncbi:MAG: HAD family phosphatase [Prevotellaceae bacterium]|jgi:beta-phosphoglucomutase family hydrolase|nr:HAD family phosphatase [Prevotellaceae bacterium]